MSWEAIGAIGEVLGAVAVFCSLVYLAVQIKGQNRESRALAIHEISEAFRNSVAVFSQPELSVAFAKSEAGEEVSDAERVQLNAAAQLLLRVWEEAYHQHQSKRLDTSVWTVIESQYQVFLATNALSHSWHLRKQNYDEDFRHYVEFLPKQEYVFK